MSATRGPTERARTLRRVVVTAAIVSLLTGTACLLVDPGGDLPSIPRRRPVIVQSELSPPASVVLGTYPEKLIVPVELADPTDAIEYSAFLDYNPLTGQTFLDRKRITFDPSNVATAVRTLEIPLAAPVDLDRCHTIEVVVALSLSGNDSLAAHTPAPPGGDSVTWFYSPSGDLAGCPALDAGPDAQVPPRELTSADGGPP